MLIGARTGAWSGGAKLPYDAEVEWIMSDGNQILRSGVRQNRGYISFKVKSEETRTDVYYKFFGTSGSNTANRFIGYVETSRKNISVEFTGIGHIDRYNLSATIEYEKHLYTCANGTTLGDVSFFNCYYNNEDAFSIGARCKLYYAMIWDSAGKNLLLDIIPVRKSGIGYMFDRVSGKLIGNAGTGAFVIGPDK